MKDATPTAPVIGIVVKRWPRLSETFVLNEILGLERAGLRLRIYALMDPHEPANLPVSEQSSNGPRSEADQMKVPLVGTSLYQTEGERT